MNNSFFAMLGRMKYIDRWALMRNFRRENISEHSLEVAVIAHALCLIGNKRLGKSLDADRAAVIALFHDAPEIITGDMPTPVKYFDSEIRSSYQRIEDEAVRRLLDRLPEDLRDEYARCLMPDAEQEWELITLVKAADKLSALIKCLEEESAGNREFAEAEKTTLARIEAMKIPEAEIFLKDFIPAYKRTLDEL